MSKVNLSGLGLKQNKLLYRMAKESLVVRVIRDWYDSSVEIVLQNEQGDNSYEAVPVAMMRSLGKRRVFNCLRWKPSLQITIDTYSLKSEVVKSLLG